MQTLLFFDKTKRPGAAKPPLTCQGKNSILDFVYAGKFYQSLTNNVVELIIPSPGRFVVVALLFYVHGKHLRSCRDGQLT